MNLLEPLAGLTTNHLTVTGATLRENFMKCQTLLQAALAVPAATAKHFLSA